MKRKRISAAEAQTPLSVVLITLDNHVSGAAMRAYARLRKDLQGLSLEVFAATDWDNDPDQLQKARHAVAGGDIIIVTMLFLENQIEAILPALQDRRDDCDAMVCCMCAADVMRLTKMGRFSMDGEPGAAMSLLKRLRGKSNKTSQSAGAQQLSVLRRLPRILKFIPGTAQDVRAYFLTLQYWLAGSEDNLARLIVFLMSRYASGERECLRDALPVEAPLEYPDTGVYHPTMSETIAAQPIRLPKPRERAGTVGLLLMRSYAIAGNTEHYDAVIGALEARGLQVIPAFASGLDARPAVERFFMEGGSPCVDAVISLTGFSLVGGPAYNDTDAAQQLLSDLNVPYLAVQALEFQSLEQWDQSAHGLLPIEATMMVAIPELDGATGSMVFGGRSDRIGDATHSMAPHEERINRLADRVAALVRLRHKARAEKKIGIVLFNFPPNSGASGTAAHLDVFTSLWNTLQALAEQGYSVTLPETVDDLRKHILEGNRASYGSECNVLATVDVNQHVADERYLEEIEAQWGPAPGKHSTDGQRLFLLGQDFGNVVVGIQPAMGYEGDPMRLLFEGGCAPTHAFSAFYRWLREEWRADAVLHFGTHGALEFMPGKQIGLSERCWPDRLIGSVPNFYLYAANNPSEGLIAKRRSAATLISYLTPPVTQVDLYRGLADLKGLIERWRQRDTSTTEANTALLEAIKAAAEQCDLVNLGTSERGEDIEQWVSALKQSLDEIECTLIPFGLHVVGETISEADQGKIFTAVLETAGYRDCDPSALFSAVHAQRHEDLSDLLAQCGVPEAARGDLIDRLDTLHGALAQDSEIPALIRAFDGQFIPPVSGGDLLRSPEMLPTGRNLHGFDPFRMPTAFAMVEGSRQAEQLLDRHREQGLDYPKSIALVLWGTDNLKSEGVAIGQALALMGAEPRFDGYGRLAGAKLLPLETLGRPRIDVMTTLSGIFRDLLPMQAKLLAEAAYLAAMAEEPEDMNFVRAHTLAYQQEQGVDFDTAALRVFSNAEGAYGSNVNMMLDSGCWENEDELADCYTKRKGFAYGRDGRVSQQGELLGHLLSDVDLAYQNLDSVELGVTTVDHYFDTLGGISRAARRARGEDIPVYIADHTAGGTGCVRTLDEQVALETRTRLLNPQWYESMLAHGYEGVRQIESHITNTLGWSATTGGVAPWVYQQVSETFILDEAMRKRLAELNPVAASRVANRLLEAQERDYWGADEASLEALRKAGEDLEDWLEGIGGEVAA
jgi:magnesium chelatase subunit H